MARGPTTSPSTTDTCTRRQLRLRAASPACPWPPTESLAPAPAGVLEHKGSGPDPARQEGRTPTRSCPTPAGRWLLSVDLGTDSVRVCEPGPTGLTVRHEVALRPGTGPRLAFHPGGRVAYV
ncbi:hypothetical protein SMD44_08380 [Streptomyces alboflavus]|uniref:Uncharacterized protein n=1 Tax=Streptomyces alboflavus TaxID=67267 RepID=A0A1Z1WR15_9ACTN|nr:hypothetical protein SMD44_08380 [Streptomyces alboflavus]